MATFYIAQTKASGNLISSTTAQDLGLISVHIKVSGTKDNKLGTVLNKHEQLFHGLGKLKGEKVKLNIDKDQTPIKYNHSDGFRITFVRK